jgi:hypothetical protein
VGAELSAAALGSDAEVELVGARLRDIDRVFQPLAGDDVADVVSAADVAGDADIDRFVAVRAQRRGRGVVEGDAFAAGVVVVGLDLGGAGTDVERSALLRLP